LIDQDGRWRPATFRPARCGLVEQLLRVVVTHMTGTSFCGVCGCFTCSNQVAIGVEHAHQFLQDHHGSVPPPE
jgi:hypothetical protein